MNLSVTFLDALIVLIIIVSAGYAAWRGFLWETLTIFAWVAAAFGCLYFGPYVIPLVRGMVKEDWLATLIAYAAVFLAVFIPFAFMSHRFSESVKHSPIGPLDRAAGVAFGVVRGLVIIGLAYLAFTYFVAIRSQPSWLTQARLLPMVQSTAEVLLSMVPNHPGDYAFAHHDNGPEPEIQQETSAQPPERHDPMADLIRQGKAPAQPARPDSMADLIRGKTPAAAPAARKSDSMADLIAHDGDAASVKTAREPVPQKSSSHAAKSAGTTDRQQLDKLIETGGNGNR
jgi:membrane protein required for colicin V production